MRRRLKRLWLDLPIRYKGLMVIMLPVVSVTVTIVLRQPFNRQQEQIRSAFERAATTRNAAQDLLVALMEVETNARGYTVTRSPEFLAGFKRATEAMPATIQSVTELASGTAEQPALEEAAALTTRRIELAGSLVEAVDAGADPWDPAVLGLMVQGQQTMEEIRARLTAFRQSRDAQLIEARERLRRLRRLLGPIILITFFGGLIGALAGGWLFATGIAERISALEYNADRLARGERLEQIGTRGADEIGSLNRTLRRASLLLRSRERELRAVNARLERTIHEQSLLNRELEAFSYSVSHDLRAPLRSIDGFAQALREDWGDRLDEAGQDHLSRVRNAAQRMGRLIDDLLNLSRLTRTHLERIDVDLSRLAHEISLELTARNPGRDVTWVIAPDLRASCDPALARILLDNLLGNAWKFSSKTPSARIEFSALPDTRPTTFAVRDNGAGFDMRYVEKLFAPFQRLHADREFPGTGIGLATVQRIVHKHGGEVRTVSKPGEGAVFYFTLEAAARQAA